MAEILWLATGLSSDLTGIERVVVDTVTYFAALDVSQGVLVDTRADWPDLLPASATILRRPRPKGGVGRRPPATQAIDPQLIHSFGPPHPIGGSPRRNSYTVHDWGPLFDSEMAAPARLSWGRALITGIRSSSLLHFMAESTRREAPAYLEPWLSRRRAVYGLPYPVREPRNSGGGPQPLREPNLILSVGTAVARKRFPLLIAGVSGLDGARLSIVGTNTEKLAVGRSGRIDARGRVDEAELRALYGRATVFALVSAYEGFGLPALEAWSAGCRLVLTEAVARRLPDDILHGALIAPNDATPEQLAALLRRALELGVNDEPNLRDPSTAPLLCDVLHQRLLNLRVTMRSKR
jgi:glycosyltransferase involved in cell wall biosynthesis